MEDGVSFALWHIWISMPTPTPHHHNTDTHDYPHSHCSWLVPQALSLRIKQCQQLSQTPYRVAHRQPRQCLQVYCSARWLLQQLFFSSFSLLYLLDMSTFLLLCILRVMSRSLAPGANTLSSQSGDNDYHLDLCLIKSFPVRSNNTPLFPLCSFFHHKSAHDFTWKGAFHLHSKYILREFASQQPGPPRISNHTKNFNYMCGSNHLMNEWFTCWDNKGRIWIQSQLWVIKPEAIKVFSRFRDEHELRHIVWAVPQVWISAVSCGALTGSQKKQNMLCIKEKSYTIESVISGQTNLWLMHHRQ